jgi:hypothetical protein
MGDNKTFREKLFFRKIFCVKGKLFPKTIPGPKNFRGNKNFREISRKSREFSLIFAFRENEKRGFRFNPGE